MYIHKKFFRKNNKIQNIQKILNIKKMQACKNNKIKNIQMIII